MNKILATFAIASLIIFTGCNTIKGVGQDVSKAGEKVTHTAEKTETKLQ